MIASLIKNVIKLFKASDQASSTSASIHCHHQLQSGLQGLASRSSQFCFLPTSFCHHQWYWLYPCSHWRLLWPCHQQSRVGFGIFSNDELTQQGAGAHLVFTSSTRMELEAVRNALKAVKDMKAPPTIIVATDSMAILCKIQSGCLPGEWFDLRDAHPIIKVIWVFVPGQSGVTCNETADMLASSCYNFTPLDLFSSDLKVMGTKSWKDQLTTSIQSGEEGRRLIILGISLGSSLFSTRAGDAKAIYNQLLTGNISYSTLLMLLRGACGWREDQCSSTSSVNPLRQSKAPAFGIKHCLTGLSKKLTNARNAKHAKSQFGMRFTL